MSGKSTALRVEASKKQAISYKKFTQLWQEFFPNVVVAKPRTDLCLTSQQNTAKLQSTANLSESKKAECILAQLEHFDCAQAERDFYEFSCNRSKKTLETLGTEALLNLETLRLVSLETRLVSFESFLVSRECTASTSALHCGNTQSQRSNTMCGSITNFHFRW